MWPLCTPPDHHAPTHWQPKSVPRDRTRRTERWPASERGPPYVPAKKKAPAPRERHRELRMEQPQQYGTMWNMQHSPAHYGTAQNNTEQHGPAWNTLE
eukprot:gene17963-biopygen18924